MTNPCASAPDACPILIAGPTASGKSALALALAERLGGCVINADALQVYADWHILTARPSAADTARAPHRLYGHVPAAQAHSVGAWLRELRAVLDECAREGWRPIIVGGTGLYFRALTTGLAEIPEPDAAVRQAAEARFAEAGCAGLMADLEARDPDTLAGIDTNNPARLRRAWEVLQATGRGLAAWRATTPPPLLPPSACLRMRLMPERNALYARCDARLAAMPRAGILDEVSAMMANGLPLSAPALKAVGAPEFMGHLRGACSFDEALAQAQQATRNYAKRQYTWLRNQMGDWPAVSDTDEALEQILP